MREALALRDVVDGRVRAAARRDAPVRVTVVGGGAGAVEVALAIHRRIADAGREPAVTIVERGGSIVPDFEPGARRRLAALLERRGVAVLLRRRVAEVRAGAVVLDAGTRRRSDLTVWVAGAAPPPVLGASDLPRRDGYFLVDATLRAADGAPVWGAGDCVALADHPVLPKAGVYAVRQGPVLAHNLRAALGGGAPRRYEPQRDFLALLNTADARAFYRWRGLSGRARWAWLLKDVIDRRWVRQYQ
jgi:selenide,water dikinase